MNETRNRAAVLFLGQTETAEMDFVEGRGGVVRHLEGECYGGIGPFGRNLVLTVLDPSRQAYVEIITGCRAMAAFYAKNPLDPPLAVMVRIPGDLGDEIRGIFAEHDIPIVEDPLARILDERFVAYAKRLAPA